MISPYYSMSPDVTEHSDGTINIGEGFNLRLTKPFIIKTDFRTPVKT